MPRKPILTNEIVDYRLNINSKKLEKLKQIAIESSFKQKKTIRVSDLIRNAVETDLPNSIIQITEWQVGPSSIYSIRFPKHIFEKLQKRADEISRKSGKNILLSHIIRQAIENAFFKNKENTP